MWFGDVWLLLLFDKEVFDVLWSVTFAFDLLVNTAHKQKQKNTVIIRNAMSRRAGDVVPADCGAELHG